mmetsp:Transcript_5797/g.8536  ORF Transcript_5797/g.8536 Transcript_5797/m.8536 type:complete len:121 (-) Transcript_5797:1570-1932(-)
MLTLLLFVFDIQKELAISSANNGDTLENCIIINDVQRSIVAVYANDCITIYYCFHISVYKNKGGTVNREKAHPTCCKSGKVEPNKFMAKTLSKISEVVQVQGINPTTFGVIVNKTSIRLK